MTVEECLLAIRSKAALVRYLTSSQTITEEVPDSAVFAGLAEICSDIERLARMITGAVGIKALSVEITACRRACSTY
jgi:hypothetical protein